jgi:hypothetical protein
MSASISWHSEIIERRKGAGYFLSQTGHPYFKPAEYIKYRALQIIGLELRSMNGADCC